MPSCMVASGRFLVETKKRPLYFKTKKRPMYSKTKTTVSIISYGSVNSKAVATSSLVKSSTYLKN